MAKETTVVIPCTCKHEFQDATYGLGMRVHNVNDKGQAYCTVCATNYKRNKNTTDIERNMMLGMVMMAPKRGARIAKNVLDMQVSRT